MTTHSIRIDVPIWWTLNRCQQLRSPFALIQTFEHSYLVPCYKMQDLRLTPIDFSNKTSLSEREVFMIPNEMWDTMYDSRWTERSFSGTEVIVNATYPYADIAPPNFENIQITSPNLHQIDPLLMPHCKMQVAVNEHGLPQLDYDCAACANRIDCLGILADIFSQYAPSPGNDFYKDLSDIMVRCSFEFMGTPTTPTPSEPPTPSPKPFHQTLLPSPRPTSQTPLPSPRPPSRAPSRLDLDVSPTFQTGDFPVQFIGKVS